MSGLAPPNYLVDTNLIVRLLTGDPPDIATRVQRAFEHAAAGRHALIVVPVVAAEAAYVLTSFYDLPRADVADGLRRVFGLAGVRVRKSAVIGRTLDPFAEHAKLKWVDAYLLALAASEAAGVATLDRPLARAAPGESRDP